jgi:hypothetical protein
MVGLPRQISQRSQVFKQLGAGVHGRQRVGSLRSSKVQVPSLSVTEPSKTDQPSSSGKAQQPKQSHPFGVIAPHWSSQATGCTSGQ